MGPAFTGLRERMLGQDLGAGSAPSHCKDCLGSGSWNTKSPRHARRIPNVQVGTTPTLVPWLLGKNYMAVGGGQIFFRLVKLM